MDVLKFLSKITSKGGRELVFTLRGERGGGVGLRWYSPERGGGGEGGGIPQSRGSGEVGMCCVCVFFQNQFAV
jgi:hypothetical protein